MRIRAPRASASLLLAGMVILACSTAQVTKKPEAPEPEPRVRKEQPATVVAEQPETRRYLEEENLLARIVSYYEDAGIALAEGDYPLAETLLDSAAVISADIDIESIDDPDLAFKLRETLAFLFQEYGAIFTEVDRIKREEPMAWLDELSASDPEQFKNGIWHDDELRKIVQKIALRCDVPIDYNEQVKKAIYFFQTVKRKEMEKWMRRSGRFLPLIHDILEEEDLPLDMAYLAMIESGFSARAYSRARASGLWQFIYSTGRLYGLDRTQWLDERRDPVKATKAAVQHLKDLYKMYNDWRLVMAAYNCGPTRVTRQHRAGNDDFWTMTLPRETRNYVPSFMAAVVISKAPELFGFDNIETEAPMSFDVVNAPPYMSLSDAAACAGVTLDDIKELNTELLRDRTPAGKEDYALRIPAGTRGRFVTELAKIPRDKYIPPQVSTYRVRRGDTLSQIAERFRVSVSNLMAVNGISNPRRLRAGQQLKIPGKSGGSSSSTASASAVTRQVSSSEVEEARDDTFTYTVRRNDSLWLIANRNNTTISMLQALNGLGRSSKIVPGQKILVPRESGETQIADSNVFLRGPTPPGEITYIIRNGDTLYEIAKKYKVSYKDIMTWNRIKNHRTIKPGQKIIIRTK